MNGLPTIMKIRISNQDTKFYLWLPLFIILPVVLVILAALFLILLPLLLMVALVFWRFALWRPILIFWPAIIACLGALRGLEVDINQNSEKVFILIK